jgi:hypothetical protein
MPPGGANDIDRREQKLAISAPTKTRDAAIPPHLPGSMPRLGMSLDAIHDG